MLIREVQAKSIHCRSRVYDYVVNPYTGCQHACSYCYARFMKRFSGHEEAWGDFVDVKINAPDLLRREIARKKMGNVWISGVCDPYQPLEARYRLTRECLRIIIEHHWPFVIQTRSPLVLRDIDLIQTSVNGEVGLTVTTSDDDIRRLFEPHAPPVKDRIRALEELHRSGIRTFAMIAPLLPGAEKLPEMLKDRVDYIIVDRMNYHYGNWVYRKHGLLNSLSDDFFNKAGEEILSKCTREALDCRLLY
ncbi:MAG: radical SAM protein [Dehalococcoidales bacterium]|nr:radical SAM protein [Dehalococcoidales bacterium]